LKTARWQDDTRVDTVEEGELYFNRQVREMERAEKRKQFYKAVWRHRRSAAAGGMAVLVGALAVWLRKSPLARDFVTALWDQWSDSRGK